MDFMIGLIFYSVEHFVFIYKHIHALDKMITSFQFFNCIFMNENVWISFKIPLKFVSNGPFDSNLAMVLGGGY